MFPWDSARFHSPQAPAVHKADGAAVNGPACCNGHAVDGSDIEPVTLIVSFAVAEYQTLRTETESGCLKRHYF